MATISLQQFGVVPDEDDSTHVFTFLFEHPQRLLDGATRAVESSEVSYMGARWSIVCMRKEERYMGMFLKWRYSDGPSAGGASCRAKYSLRLVHRRDDAGSRRFASSQRFCSSQALLGKSKLVLLDEMLDPGAGFLDAAGKRVVVELTMRSCTMRYEQRVDASSRARKNASGYYVDTTPFLFAAHRWHLRVYPSKTNAAGLPALYLYMTSRPRALAIELGFTLHLGDDQTELLAYCFGDGAKFDGFGKTLPAPLYGGSSPRGAGAGMVTISVEIRSMTVFKDFPASLRGGNATVAANSAIAGGTYAPQLYKEYRSYGSGSYGTPALTAAESFQDHEGNFWRANVDREAGGGRLAVNVDKGVHHYPHSRTKLLCVSGTLLARDPNDAPDVDLCGEPLVGYFSNFIDEKGYLMSFPIKLSALEERGNPYASPTGEILLRINFLSVQTIPTAMRSLPRFDYQGQHLLRARQQLSETQRSLEDMRDMSASRASLSGMCIDSPAASRITSPSDSDSDAATRQGPVFTSFNGFDDVIAGSGASGSDDDVGSGAKAYFRDMLQHLSTMTSSNNNGDDDDGNFYTTSRDLFVGTREDVSTESGVAMSDECSLLQEARPSPVDLSKQREVVATLIAFFKKKIPLRINHFLEFGSLGSGTSVRSRMDVDLVIYSPDLPATGQHRWMPSLLHALSQCVQQAAANPDSGPSLPPCACYTTTPYAMQFTCADVDVDVMFSLDWEADDSSNKGALYDVSCKQTTRAGRQWCALASARQQWKFIKDQPNELKEIIKVVKHWRNCVQWKKSTYRPNSYLLSLLVIKAFDETKTFDIKNVLEKMGSYVLAPELSLSWSTYYLPEKYPVEFEPPTPLVRDPANPCFNVAETLPYWGQFRSECIAWLRSLNIVVSSLAST